MSRYLWIVKQFLEFVIRQFVEFPDEVMLSEIPYGKHDDFSGANASEGCRPNYWSKRPDDSGDSGAPRELGRTS